MARRRAQLAAVQTPAQPAERPLRGRVVGEPSPAALESLAEFLLRKLNADAARGNVSEEKECANVIRLTP